MTDKKQTKEKNTEELTFQDLHEALTYIQVNLKAPKGQFNKFGGYNYRNCEDILNAVKPYLEKTKTHLLIKDAIELVGERYYIKATVTLSGYKGFVTTEAYARETFDKKGMDASQITGSASSYARKYALNGLFCIDDTKDADSDEKQPEKKQEPEQESVKQKPNAEISPSEANSLIELADLCGFTASQICKKYGVQAVAFLTRNQYEESMNGFDKLYKEGRNEEARQTR